MLAAVTLPPNPSEDRATGVPHGQPVHLPPPSGPPAGLPLPPATPYGAPYVSDPGTNGLAIAALVCGLAFFVPFAAVLAIIFGIIALRQIARTFQRGRGLAIGGIVTGTLVILGWVGLIAFVVTADSVTSPAAAISAEEAFVDELQPGDCFTGLVEDSSDPVTVHPCSEPHQAQLVSSPKLDGDFPGAEQVLELAGSKCDGAVEPRIRDDVAEELDLFFVAPETALDWRLDRRVHCVLAAVDGEMTGSILK